MESPHTLKGWTLGLVGGFTAVALVCSIYLNDYSILLNGLIGFVLFLVACVVIQSGIGVLFLPLFWLLNKFTKKKGR